MSATEKLGELRYYIDSSTVEGVPIFPASSVPNPYVQFDMGDRQGAITLVDPPITNTNPLNIQTQDGIKTAVSPSQRTRTFTPDKKEVKVWTVPDGTLNAIEVVVEGAGGGAGAGNYFSGPDVDEYGYAGGRVEATLSLDPGDTLYIYSSRGGKSGQQNKNGNTAIDGTGGHGGWGAHGGSRGGYASPSAGAGGGGGGASEVRLNGNTDSDAILSAGGGEGGDGTGGSGAVGGEHASEGGRGDGDGLVIDSGRITSSTTISGGGGAGSTDAFDYDSNADKYYGEDGFVEITFVSSAETETFTYTSKSAQTWSPPSTLFGSVKVIVEGAGGGGAVRESNTEDAYDGKPGGKVEAELDIGPSDTLYLYAPRGGQGAPNDYQAGSGRWGAHNGSGGQDQSEAAAGGGGGSAEVRLNGDTDSDAILSAGGGRGGDARDNSNLNGGDGGEHASEGGRGPADGLVIDGSRVLSSTTTEGGGGDGGGSSYRSNAGNGENGRITIKYFEDSL